MNLYNKEMDKVISELANDIAKQTQCTMIEQLNELISRKLLVWEQTQFVLTQDQLTAKINYSFLGRLRLKDQEYIESLETEIKILRAQLEAVQLVIKPRDEV